MHVDDGANNTVVTDNVVGNAGSRGGIVVEGQLTAGTVLARNRVGISLDGTAIPNAGGGISVTFHAVSTTIGPGNIVTNQVDGVVVGPENDDDRNRITQNSIYGNSGLGIDVLPAGINPNGFYPANGPNQAAQFPALGTASPTSVTRPRLRRLHRRDLHRRRPGGRLRRGPDVRRLRRGGGERHLHRPGQPASQLATSSPRRRPTRTATPRSSR